MGVWAQLQRQTTPGSDLGRQQRAAPQDLGGYLVPLLKGSHTMYKEFTDAALDQCKTGGDPQAAVALAILALAAAVHDLDTTGIATALDGVGTSIENAAL